MASWILVPTASLFWVILLAEGDPSRFNELIKGNLPLLTSIGVVIFLASLTLVSSNLANRSAAKIATSNRLVQSELKIAEFRQKWINELRDDLSELSSEIHPKSAEAKPGKLPDKVRNDVQISYLRARIEMRLKRIGPKGKREKEDRVREAIGKANSVWNASEAKTLENAIAELNESSNDLLKAEWDRLKDDIKNANLLAEGTQ